MWNKNTVYHVLDESNSKIYPATFRKADTYGVCYGHTHESGLFMSLWYPKLTLKAGATPFKLIVCGNPIMEEGG